jgi:predicted amino acid-binding ACT domain protein
MAFTIRRVHHFYTTVNDEPGKAYAVLSQLAEHGVNLLAFTGVPMGLMRTELTLFPEDEALLKDVATKARLSLDGPHPALLVQGDDELGAAAAVHERLWKAGVNVYASSGVSDGRGSFGYVIFVRPAEFEQAAAALGV